MTSTTLRREDGTILDQKNRWGIDGEVIHPKKYNTEEGADYYHTFETDYYFFTLEWPIGIKITPVSDKIYWSHRIGDHIEMADPIDNNGLDNTVQNPITDETHRINPYNKGGG
jgi:hypothetical protein